MAHENYKKTIIDKKLTSKKWKEYEINLIKDHKQYTFDDGNKALRYSVILLKLIRSRNFLVRLVQLFWMI